MSINGRDLEDRRHFFRMAVDTEVRFRLDGEAATHLGRTRNLSATGILFETTMQIQAGQVLNLRVEPAHAAIPALKAVVNVIRVDEESPGVYVVAGEMHEVR